MAKLNQQASIVIETDPIAAYYNRFPDAGAHEQARSK